jgi:hypothetical protein
MQIIARITEQNLKESVARCQSEHTGLTGYSAINLSGVPTDVLSCRL